MDSFILSFDRFARTISGGVRAARATPSVATERKKSSAAAKKDAIDASSISSTTRKNSGLSDSERILSAALMRVNHAGEVAAQALYDGQSLFARDATVKSKLREAANEELDHLAWTRERLTQLGGRTSALDPLWYAGAFAIGAAAAAVGDKVSLAFLEATENQVEAHLASHLERLPANDVESRAIIDQMKRDEASHAQTARDLGASPLPWFAQSTMKAAAKVMTSVSERI